jgi:hypothetical protein
MWETLERARRRLLRDDPLPEPNAARSVATGAVRDETVDLTLALGRAELERLIGALADDDGAGRPDTPARLQAALGRIIETVAGTGIPTVTRRPAGLYTPETWQIEIVHADGNTRTAVDRALRGGGAL